MNPNIAQDLYEYDSKFITNKEFEALAPAEQERFWELMRGLKANPKNFLQLAKMLKISDLFQLVEINKDGNLVVNTGISGICDIELTLNILEAYDFYPGG